MIQDVLRSIGGVGNYGVISILIFFTFFGSVLIWAIRLKRSYLENMSVLPLEDDETASASKGDSCDE
jgi:hypothetical protein